MKLYKQHPVLRALPSPAADATIDDVKAYLSEHGLVAVPKELSQEQRHKIKLQGDYCMQECEEFYSMILIAAQGDER